MPDLNSFPKPPFSIGFAGIFDKAVFLPHREPHVAAWHINWLERASRRNPGSSGPGQASYLSICDKELVALYRSGESPSQEGVLPKGLLPYQKQLTEWLNLKREDFLSHVTIARSPFILHEWKAAFQPLPMYVKNIRLYESLGYSQYKLLWDYPILAPFSEIEHTADIAFIIRGNLYIHAQLALAFHFPQMIRYFDRTPKNNLDEIIPALNVMIARADSEIGCPFKAVSFHGELTKDNEWEMIVDV